MFEMLLDTDEVGNIAPIVVVMLFCRAVFAALAIAFERIAGKLVFKLPCSFASKKSIIELPG